MQRNQAEARMNDVQKKVGDRSKVKMIVLGGFGLGCDCGKGSVRVEDIRLREGGKKGQNMCLVARGV